MPGWGSVTGVGGTSLLGSLGFGPGLLEQTLKGAISSTANGGPDVVRPATVATATGRRASLAQAATRVQETTAGGSGGAGQPDWALLAKDDFLRLLLTELRMQDPINPLSDREFLAQLAQFSTLEQMTNLSATIEKVAAAEELFYQQQQALALLGRQVEVATANPGSTSEEIIRGRVDAVEWKAGGAPLLKIGERTYPLDAVRRVLPE